MPVGLIRGIHVFNDHRNTMQDISVIKSVFASQNMYYTVCTEIEKVNEYQ